MGLLHSLPLTFSPEYARFTNVLPESLFLSKETIRQLLFKIKVLEGADEPLRYPSPFGQKLKSIVKEFPKGNFREEPPQIFFEEFIKCLDRFQTRNKKKWNVNY